MIKAFKKQMVLVDTQWLKKNVFRTLISKCRIRGNCVNPKYMLLPQTCRKCLATTTLPPTVEVNSASVFLWKLGWAEPLLAPRCVCYRLIVILKHEISYYIFTSQSGETTYCCHHNVSFHKKEKSSTHSPSVSLTQRNLIEIVETSQKSNKACLLPLRK